MRKESLEGRFWAKEEVVKG